MEELNMNNIPLQLYFFMGEQNFEFGNRIVQLEIDQDSMNLFGLFVKRDMEIATLEK